MDFYAMIITEMHVANSAAIRLPEGVFAPKIRLPPEPAESYQEPDLACFWIIGWWIRGLK
jgi:hypothetical protein